MICSLDIIIKMRFPFFFLLLGLNIFIHSYFYSISFVFLLGFSASGCPIANRNKLRALEMESVVEKQRSLNGSHHSSNGNNGPNTNNSSYMTAVGQTTLPVPLSAPPPPAIKIDGISCTSLGCA